MMSNTDHTGQSCKNESQDNDGKVNKQCTGHRLTLLDNISPNCGNQAQQDIDPTMLRQRTLDTFVTRNSIQKLITHLQKPKVERNSIVPHMKPKYDKLHLHMPVRKSTKLEDHYLQNPTVDVQSSTGFQEGMLLYHHTPGALRTNSQITVSDGNMTIPSEKNRTITTHLQSFSCSQYMEK